MRVSFRNGKDEVLGTVTVQDGRAVWHGFAPNDEITRDTNMLEPGTLKVVTPADGDRWLRALLNQFRSPYFRAVLETDEGVPLTHQQTVEWARGVVDESAATPSVTTKDEVHLIDDTAQ